MASDSFQLKVYTPAGLQLSEQVSTVTVPSSQGQIGILPQHTQYVGLLGTGIMEFTVLKGETRRAVVSQGFCNFAGDTLTVLADNFDLPESTDLQAFSKERDSLKKIVESTDLRDPEWLLAKTKLERIESLESLVQKSR